jgi:hypothetical protein
MDNTVNQSERESAFRQAPVTQEKMNAQSYAGQIVPRENMSQILSQQFDETSQF